MIPVQNGEWLSFVLTDEDHSIKAWILLAELIANRSNLRQEWGINEMLPCAHALGNFGNREVAASELSPLGPWKYPDLAKVRVRYFHLIPVRAGGNLLPQSTMPKEQQGSPFCVLVRIV
jgi:hypothetical protein